MAIRGEPPIDVQNNGVDTLVRYNGIERRWIKLVSSTTVQVDGNDVITWAFVEVQPSTPGNLLSGWVETDGGISGDYNNNPAIDTEIGSTASAGDIVEAWRGYGYQDYVLSGVPGYWWYNWFFLKPTANTNNTWESVTKICKNYDPSTGALIDFTIELTTFQIVNSVVTAISQRCETNQTGCCIPPTSPLSCGSGDDPCNTNAWANTLVMHFTEKTGRYACLPDTANLTRSSPGPWSAGTITALGSCVGCSNYGGLAFGVHLGCDYLGRLRLWFHNCGSDLGPPNNGLTIDPLEGWTCSPISVSFYVTAPMLDCWIGGGTSCDVCDSNDSFKVTITT